jgi:Sensors of blue-light using FAD
METMSVRSHDAQHPEHGLFQIIYLSSATALLTRDELLDLLEKGRRRNAKIGITGLLLYKDGNMMHALEGEEETVRALYKKICRDRRHRRIIPLIQEPIRERQFPDWSMAFRDLDAADGRDIPGYNEFLNTPLTEKEFSSDLTRCQKLLLLFKRNMR